MIIVVYKQLIKIHYISRIFNKDTHEMGPNKNSKVIDSICLKKGDIVNTFSSKIIFPIKCVDKSMIGILLKSNPKYVTSE